MRTYSLLTAFLVLAILPVPDSHSQEFRPKIEFKEENGFLSLTIPLSSFQRNGKGTLSVVGEGIVEHSPQQVRLEIRPNNLRPRSGVTPTEKSCLISFDEELFRTLAKKLSVPLGASTKKLMPHEFHLIETEGSLDNAEKAPATLEVLDLAQEDFYSEWYIEIDVQRKKLLLSEKNNQYRAAFVETFLH